MKGNLDAPPIVIGQKRRWIVLLLPVVFLGQLASAYARGDPSEISILIVLTVAMCGLAAVVLLRPARMEIASDGVRLIGALRTWKRSWSQIEAFRPVNWYGRCIGFDYAEGAASRSGRAQAMARMAGAEGLMGRNMEIDADQICALLNEGRRRWLGTESHSPAASCPSSLSATVWLTYMTLLVGRVSRRFYWISIGVMAAICMLIGVGLNQPIVAAPIAYMGLWFIAGGRLRDFGRSRFWLFAVFPVLFVLAIVAAVFGSLGAGAIGAAVASILVLGGPIVALGIIPGNSGANRFGADPVGQAKVVGDVFS